MTNNGMGEVVELVDFHGFKFNSLIDARDKLTALGYVPLEYSGLGDSPPWSGWERWGTLTEEGDSLFAIIRFEMGRVAYLDFEDGGSPLDEDELEASMDIL